MLLVPNAEISGSEPPGIPQIQQVYGAMNPLLAYTLALMHLSAFYIPRGSGKTTWEPTSTSTSTATPCFRAEILGSEPPGTPQIQQVYGAMNPLLAYTLAPMHLSAFYIPRGSGKTTWEPTSTSTSTATPCFRAEILGSRLSSSSWIDSESEPILTGPGNLLPPGGPGPTQLAPVLVRRASIVARCAPEGVPSGHEEGEARQLKTNPFPTQSYPTRKRQVQPISSNKPRDGRVGEKFVTSNAAEGSCNL
ncbi:hypothetical protein THAOC_13035 [Thalassiosira oceanica]|uniref:Uncharacterized protein n=1 Tax=Thalassiosira oceanica TaxID=159749 RepID=K0SYI7_THAOC|nr:hypothetical protein THAOC_13035 [Thalassiosira oceanica]|eukprot:EJK66061.1 hypothetical protein THAOC_13035 [Thalassiosira oceanica]